MIDVPKAPAATILRARLGGTGAARPVASGAAGLGAHGLAATPLSLQRLANSKKWP